jgi:hypothetical protein
MGGVKRLHYAIVVANMGCMDDGNNSNRKELKFNLDDINKQPAPEYFVRVRKKVNLRAFFATLNKLPMFKGWRKFALLALVSVAVIIPIVVNIANRSNPPEPEPEINPVEASSAIYQEAFAVSQGDSDTAYFDALAVFDDALEKTQNETLKNEIRFQKAQFYHMQSMDDDAIALLLELKDSENLTDPQRSNVFIQLTAIYLLNGNTDEAEMLSDEYNKLYPGGD